MVLKYAVSLHRDFFIVLDLRLTKRLVDSRETKLPFVLSRKEKLEKKYQKREIRKELKFLNNKKSQSLLPCKYNFQKQLLIFLLIPIARVGGNIINYETNILACNYPIHTIMHRNN